MEINNVRGDVTDIPAKKEKTAQRPHDMPGIMLALASTMGEE